MKINSNNLIVFSGTNTIVISHYFDIIIKAIVEKSNNVLFLQKVKDFIFKSRNSTIIVGEAIHLFFLYLLGFRSFIFWAQGVVAEESYMRHRSLVRKKILSFLERFALQKASLCFCVSNEQCNYYEREYNLNIRNKTIIMPCFNTALNPESFSQSKYDVNTFCYVGSLAVWQYFEETVRLYKKIEEELKEKIRFKVLTSEKNKAEEILEKYGVRNYYINFVSTKELPSELKDCKFGFILRENHIVNNVATPTKLSTYLSNGIIPIFTDSIKDFARLADRYNYLLCISNINDDKTIIDFCSEKIEVESVLKEYSDIFNEYYNENYYINMIKSQISILNL